MRATDEAQGAAVWIASTNAAVDYAGRRIMLRRGVTTVEDGNPLLELYPALFDRPRLSTWLCGVCNAESTAPLCAEHQPPLRRARSRGRLTLRSRAEA